MATFRRIREKIKASKSYERAKSFFGAWLYPHFAGELLLLLILAFTAGTSLFLRANSDRPFVSNRSLFFSHLKLHPAWNEKLVDAYESVSVRLSQQGLFEEKRVLAATAGPAATVSAKDNQVLLAALSGTTLLKPNLATTEASSLPTRDMAVYVVRGGDTVSRIALAYGVSADTILWENNLAAAGYIRPGQELRILPVSGLSHTVQKGETISGIAKQYNVGQEDILEANGIEIPEFIQAGERLLIPNGVKKAPPTPARQQYLASLQREEVARAQVPADYQGGGANLIWPVPATRRISQNFWRLHQAIDIPCKGCPTVASAEGIVELSGWQQGYGYTIVLNHGNGVKTRYAHASALSVSAGQTVAQGQAIMTSGCTGRCTGQHVHYEVIINGRFVDPLSIVAR